MSLYTILDLITFILIIIHFGLPLSYYLYLRKKWLPRSWGIKINPSYQPTVTIIVPTYNEAQFIDKKLDNIYSQIYPRYKLEVIVVDSASTDNTPEIVKEWARKHPDLNLKLIEEPVRKGKVEALNTALKYTTGEIVIITDVDAYWPTKNTINEAVKWFSDPRVGAVSCLKKPTEKGPVGVEEGYRQYYNTLRVAESKAWSTPVFHGEFAAFRKNLLEELGGFPPDIGSDDSHIATRIALMGYRSIMPEDMICIEVIPSRGYHLWRIRRAQHLIQHFIKTFTIKTKTPKAFKLILYMEAFLHLVNPWILLATLILLLTSIAMGSLIAITLLILSVFLLIYRPYRTWITTQIYLITAMIRNTWTKEITWRKQTKNAEALSRQGYPR